MKHISKHIILILITNHLVQSRRIRIVSHNALDKVILPRLFKHGAISKSHPCKADVLDVQLKQSNFLTSAENVNKLCLFVLKRPNVCENRTFAGLS